jgi:membrane protein implicated in regulation of membrane protease activity
MDQWLIWVLAAVALALGEVLSLTFIMGPIALAALLAALVAAVGAPVGVQFAALIVGSIASLLIVRPIAQRHLHTPARIRTGTAALVGSRAIVLERVDGDGGQVKIGGEVWSARSYDEDEVHEPGDRVEVMKIDGATALVSD